jgi:hypothetical protein
MRAWRRWTAAGLLALLAAAPVKAGADDAPNPEVDIVAAVAKAQSEATETSGARLEYTLKLSQLLSNPVELVEPDPKDLIETDELKLILNVGKYFVEMIAGAHSSALHKLMEDELESGFSLGLALGADDRDPSYVRTFVKNLPVPSAVYPEYGTRLRDNHNGALFAGYRQGRRLLASKALRAAFFEDIGAHMTNYVRSDYLTDNSTWSDRTWRTYYQDCASTFRASHLEE